MTTDLMSTDNMKSLISWYKSQCKPFLEQVEPQKVSSFDDDANRLLALSERKSEEVAVCFLGNAAIGKSTLINALVAGTVNLLPAGGIGPLTAQATQVRYAEDPYLEVKYHPYQELWHLILALESHHKHQLKKGHQVDGAIDSDLQVDLPEETVLETRREFARQLAESALPGDPDSLSMQMQDKVRQASLMVTGDQEKEKDIPYLIDCLLTAAQKPSHWGLEPREEDSARILRLSQAIAFSNEEKPYRTSGQTNFQGFLQKLEEHASGALAPMIRELEVGWPSPLLKEGLTLVDLPGIGISGDSYQEVTKKWIRERARAVVMVVDRGGFNEGCRKLLYESGFITRLRHSAGDPEADPAGLLVAVTRVDDLAATEYQKHRSAGNSPPKKKRDFLADVRTKILEAIQKQMEVQLTELEQSNHELTNASQHKIVDMLLERMSIHPVSAPEYTRLLIDDEDERAFIKEVSESGIPALAKDLICVAHDWQSQLREQEQRLLSRFYDRLKATLKATYSRLHEFTTEENEAEAFLLKLNALLDDLRPPFCARSGKFHEFLNATLHEKLKQGVDESANTARKTLKSKVQWFDQNLHWATLRAAIRRGGVFSGGSNVDLVNTFSLTFEDPIATTWNENVLKSLRAKTSEHARAYSSIINEVHDWALAQEHKQQSSRINAVYEELKLTIERLQYIGDELIQDLRIEVQHRLTEEIGVAIRKACKSFVGKQQDKGAGVKQRMIDFLDVIVDSITEEVKTFAQQYLLKKLDDVKQQILACVTDIGDPFARLDGIFRATTNEIQEEEKEQRRRYTEQIQQIVAIVPPSFAFSIE